MAHLWNQSLLSVIILMVTIVSNFAQELQCNCSCRKNVNQCDQPPVSNRTRFEAHDNFMNPMCHIPSLPDCMPKRTPADTCTGWDCCKRNDQTLLCLAPAERIQQIGNCSTTSNQNCYTVRCSCTGDPADERTTVILSTTLTASSTFTDELEKQTQSHREQFSTGTSVGIGLGIVLLILVAVMIALMVYCRKQGVKEGRNQSTTPLKHNATVDRKDSLSDYAEIGGNLYLGEQAFAGTTNPGYETVPKDSNINGTSNDEYTDLSKPDVPTRSHYQSLKKHSNDFGNPDYIDPENYTEPPHLKSDEHEDDDDYVRQGTPRVTTGGNDEEHFNLPQESDDYVEASLKDTNKIAHDKAHFAVTHDTDEEKNSDYVDVDDSNLSKGQTPSGSNGASDYVDVDDPNLLKGQKPSGSNDASDYVDVDDPNLLKGQKRSGSNDASDYVDVDDPGLETKSKPIEANAGSDYVDVDDQNLTKGISKAEPDSEYVKV